MPSYSNNLSTVKLTGDIETGETLLSGVKATVKRYREGEQDDAIDFWYHLYRCNGENLRLCRVKDFKKV